MPHDELDSLWPLRDVAERLNKEFGDDFVQLHNLQVWEERRNKNDFPTPKRKIGRFNFYDYDQVREWVILWKRATGRMGNPGLNGRSNGTS